MPNYCVNTGGDHEVHNLDFSTPYNHLPHLNNRMPLGWHPDDDSAMHAARAVYSNADGCYYCIDKKYHTR